MSACDRWRSGQASSPNQHILVTPGLDPGSRFFLPAPARSDQQVEQVGPVGIGSFDLVELPCAAPSLDALFVRDGFFDRVAALGPDEALELVAGAEIRALARAMLVDPGGQVGRETAYIAPGSDRPCARAKLGAPNLRAMRTSELAGASGRFPPTADPTPPRKNRFPTRARSASSCRMTRTPTAPSPSHAAARRGPLPLPWEEGKRRRREG